jgi:tRNA (adenine22-N1)-methyltransferase
MNRKHRNLGNRLRLCASFVRYHAKICDVGTDHAYLPIWLVRHGIVVSALACDVRENPLAIAKENIAHCGYQQMISTRLSNGLSAVESDEADDIIIAGMGGDLIAQIVTETPWLYNPQKHLILQPMTKPSRLRCVLLKHGFELLQEKAIFDEHRVYTVMLYRYNPKKVSFNVSSIYVGGLSGKTEAEREYLKRQENYLSHCLVGRLHSGKDTDIETLHQALEKIQKILDLTAKEDSK